MRRTARLVAVAVEAAALCLAPAIADSADANGKPANAGRMDCSGCDIRGSTLGPGAPLSDEALAFLKAISLIAYTGGTRMVVGDQVTICNGDI